MKIKLNQIQLDYLNHNFPENEGDPNFKFPSSSNSKFYYLEIENDKADEIRDWTGEELQKRGFDINYKLTSEGKILEQIIDIFYIDKY